jgi:hypothetical protein
MVCIATKRDVNGDESSAAMVSSVSDFLMCSKAASFNSVISSPNNDQSATILIWKRMKSYYGKAGTLISRLRLEHAPILRGTRCSPLCYSSGVR